MDETWLRLALVGAALIVAVLFTWYLRSRDRRSPAIDARSLGPGVYFFSSATCASCSEARQTLEAVAGHRGFTEYAWETTPDVFTEVGVETVPATLVVYSSGKTELHTGTPRQIRLPNGP